MYNTFIIYSSYLYFPDKCRIIKQIFIDCKSIINYSEIKGLLIIQKLITPLIDLLNIILFDIYLNTVHGKTHMKYVNGFYLNVYNSYPMNDFSNPSKIEYTINSYSLILFIFGKIIELFENNIFIITYKHIDEIISLT